MTELVLVSLKSQKGAISSAEDPVQDLFPHRFFWLVLQRHSDHSMCLGLFQFPIAPSYYCRIFHPGDLWLLTSFLSEYIIEVWFFSMIQAVCDLTFVTTSFPSFFHNPIHCTCQLYFTPTTPTPLPFPIIVSPMQNSPSILAISPYHAVHLSNCRYVVLCHFARPSIWSRLKTHPPCHTFPCVASHFHPAMNYFHWNLPDLILHIYSLVVSPGISLSPLNHLLLYPWPVAPI